MFILTRVGKHAIRVTSMPYHIQATFPNRASAGRYISDMWNTALASHLQEVRSLPVIAYPESEICKCSAANFPHRHGSPQFGGKGRVINCDTSHLQALANGV